MVTSARFKIDVSPESSETTVPKEERMFKVFTMLVALALFGAVPAVATAQGTQPSPGGGGGLANSNIQTGTINQGAGTGGVNGTGHEGTGGNAGNQACLVQQNAGRDANAACNQAQNFQSNAVAGRGVRTGLRTSGVRSAGVRASAAPASRA
jgi:hypothetical protein